MTWTPESFGRHVIGPITGEFCLRLWAFGSMLERPENASMLFCARGGLRLLLAYQRFLASCDLAAPTAIAPLMVSRVMAVRPAIMRITRDGVLSPSAEEVLSYEFSGESFGAVVQAIAGCAVADPQMAAAKFSTAEFARFLLAPEGAEALAAIGQQATLFEQHLMLTLNGRTQAILVDTGLFGTTVQLLREGVEDVTFSGALIARSNYRARRRDMDLRKTFGLGIETDAYSPVMRRSSILRYWHLIESTFEPDLPSVRRFTDQGGIPVSNLEMPGWRERIAAAPGTVFAGVVAYLDSLPRGDASVVVTDAAKAWARLYRTVVWPSADDATVLEVGDRSNDFGIDTISRARPWSGPLQALRGHTMWREGEIARARTRLRWPLLAAIEAAYGLRLVKKQIIQSRARWTGGTHSLAGGMGRVTAGPARPHKI